MKTRKKRIKNNFIAHFVIPEVRGSTRPSSRFTRFHSNAASNNIERPSSALMAADEVASGNSEKENSQKHIPKSATCAVPLSSATNDVSPETDLANNAVELDNIRYLNSNSSNNAQSFSRELKLLTLGAEKSRIPGSEIIERYSIFARFSIPTNFL